MRIPATNAARLAAALLAAIALTGCGVLDKLTGDDNKNIQKLAVGDCITVSGTTSSADHVKSDCAPGNSVFTVATVGAENCGENYTEYYQEDGTKRYRVCLAPNYQEGNCYKEETMKAGYTQIPCVEPKPTTNHMVDPAVKVVKATNQGTITCDDAEAHIPLTFPELNRSFCLALAG